LSLANQQEEVYVSAARQLYNLQIVDVEWAETGDRIREIVSNLGVTVDLVRAREAVIETSAVLEQLGSKLRSLELEIGGLNAKLKANQDRLYSGRVKNPKELSGLQEEATSLRRRRSELEDDQLDLMIGIEEQEAELAERQARLRQIEAMWSQNQDSLQLEKRQLEIRLEELGARRDAMRARIAHADLALYDDLCMSLGGTGVALLKRGVCQTCGVDVPTGVARSVERGEGPYYCPVCDRLLAGGA
jgi:predicted  nucleic acid-binding Zn-ribbon protein